MPREVMAALNACPADSNAANPAPIVAPRSAPCFAVFGTVRQPKTTNSTTFTNSSISPTSPYTQKLSWRSASSSEAPSTPKMPPTKNARMSCSVLIDPVTRSIANRTTQNGTRKLPSRMSVGTRLLLPVNAVTTIVMTHSPRPASSVFHHQP